MKNASVYVQRFGKFLSGMVMPNIGAFLAWGLITALFIPDGWIPNDTLSLLVDPMILYLLPLLIAYTGGKMVYGHRGGVLGAIGTIGVITGASIPMFLGAMIMGPLSALIIKYVDRWLEPITPVGFEMLFSNFSAGIIGGILASLGLIGVGPAVDWFSTGLGNVVEAFVNTGFLPLASILIEPAKILFLNNAINHGVLGPLGAAQALEAGKSIYFLLETNPGPGLGVLLAYSVFGKGFSKGSAPAASIIHFVGGIHEVYFPYVLMKPALLLAVIAGGASGVLVFDILNVGLVATPAPGSIIALALMTPNLSTMLGMFVGVLVSAVVSFLVASVIVRRGNEAEEDFEAAQSKMFELKGKKGINKIVFACDAGMGSSAMGASTLKNKFKKAGIEMNVVHCSVDSIPKDAKLVVTHNKLVPRVELSAPDSEVVGIDNFIGAPEYDELVNKFKE